MDFKILLPLLIALTTSCSKEGGDVGVIGQSLGQQTTLYNAYGVETKNIFVVDRTTNRILGLNTETMSLEHEFTLSNTGEDHYIAMDTNEKFIIDFSKKHIETINLDGTRRKGNLSFLGTPVSAAFNPTSRIMIMQDDLYSIGILKFSENGEIVDSWLGGSLIAEGKSITSGDLDKLGRLILGASDGSMIIVDVEATLTQDAWQFSSFSTGLGEIKWVGPDPTSPNLVLIASADTLGIVDTTTQTLTDSKAIVGPRYGDLTGMSRKSTSRYSQYLSDDYYGKKQIIGFSKAGKPHAIARTSTETAPNLFYAASDGKIKTHQLQNAAVGYYRQSYLSSDLSEFTLLLQSSYSKAQVLGLRLSDNLATINTTIDATGTAKFNNKVLFLDFETGLGRMDLYNLNSGSSKTIRGYNFDYLRKN